MNAAERRAEEMTETELKNTQKAMAYDINRILKQEPGRTYTAEDIEKILDAYITGTQQ